MTDEILYQLRHAPDFFAACTMSAGKAECVNCLRRLVWKNSDYLRIMVLHQGVCAPLPMSTYIRKYSILDLLDKLSHSGFLGSIHDVRQEFKPDARAARGIEKALSRYSKEPFLWEHEEEAIVWDPSIYYRGTEH